MPSASKSSHSPLRPIKGWISSIAAPKPSAIGANQSARRRLLYASGKMSSAKANACICLSVRGSGLDPGLGADRVPHRMRQATIKVARTGQGDTEEERIFIRSRLFLSGG